MNSPRYLSQMDGLNTSQRETKSIKLTAPPSKGRKQEEWGGAPPPDGGVSLAGGLARWVWALALATQSYSKRVGLKT